MGPQDLVAPKWSCKAVEKPIVTVDGNEEVMSGSLPSLVADIASSSFTLQNAANALVTESAAIWATFIQFQDTLTGSLDRLMGFLVKEQAQAQEDHHAVLDLLQQLVQVVEGVPSRQMETVRATAVGNSEAGPLGVVVYTETIALDEVGLIRWAWTPLFLLSDAKTEPSDELYVNEGEGSSSKEGSKDKNGEEDEDEEEADNMDLNQTLRD
jgi:hypothetical protein